MNLVDQIKSYLSGEVLHRLSGLVGAEEGATRTAIGAAVPALLSGLSHVASSGGAQKLVSALGHFDAGSLGNLGHMLSEQSSSLLEQGSGLLNSLLGGGLVSGITSAVSRFTGIGSAAVHKLLGYLMPVVLGGIAGRFAGKALNAQGLTSMLADQKANIAHALPSGFSLADVPGLATAGSAVRAAAGEAQRAGSSLLPWLLSAAGLALVALVLWWALHQPGAGPSPPAAAIPPGTVSDASQQLSTDLTGTFKSLGESLSSIKDAASAQLALPQLKDLSAKLDGMKALMDKVPEAGKAKMTALIQSQLGQIDDQLAKLLWVPGVGDKIKPTVDEVMGKLASLGGMAVPQASKVSSELASTFSSLSDTLTGIKDPTSAEAALPKLKDLNDKLDVSKDMMAGLSDAGKSTIRSLIQAALAKLKDVANKVVAIAGVGDKVKPVVDSILGKLTTLAG
jgi:hypothetical protein